MGEVVAFRPRFGRPSSSSPAPAIRTAPTPARERAVLPGSPAWFEALWERYSLWANWSVSRKGNRYIVVGGYGGFSGAGRGGYCIAVFRRKGGWASSMARSAEEGPLFSRQTYDAPDEARSGAWEALLALEGPKQA